MAAQRPFVYSKPNPPSLTGQRRLRFIRTREPPQLCHPSTCRHTCNRTCYRQIQHDSGQVLTHLADLNLGGGGRGGQALLPACCERHGTADSQATSSPIHVRFVGYLYPGVRPNSTSPWALQMYSLGLDSGGAQALKCAPPLCSSASVERLHMQTRIHFNTNSALGLLLAPWQN